MLHLKKPAQLDWLLTGSILFLLALGLLEIYSLSPSLDGGFLNFKKQFFFTILGICLMTLFSFFDYRFLREKTRPVIIFYFIVISLLATLLLIGDPIGGARSWFKLGIFSLEPVELAKLVLIIILAKFFSSRHTEIFLARHLIISSAYLITPLILVVFQPDLGSALILFFIWVGLLMISGIKKKHLIIAFIILIIIGISAWLFFLQNYQKARILSYLMPEQDPLGQGYNLVQSLTAISSGGFFGKGLGNGSVAQLGFLPARHTDFIFASIVEEMGLVGGIIILLAYLIIFWRLIKISVKSKDNFGRLLTMGTFIFLTSHCLINLGMNVGIMPITGISLPLVSYGGSGLITTSILLGLTIGIDKK